MSERRRRQFMPWFITKVGSLLEYALSLVMTPVTMLMIIMR